MARRYAVTIRATIALPDDESEAVLWEAATRPLPHVVQQSAIVVALSPSEDTPAPRRAEIIRRADRLRR